MSLYYIPEELENAWERYEKHFGNPLPSYYSETFGQNSKGQIEFINKCISENKEAPYKKLHSDEE